MCSQGDTLSEDVQKHLLVDDKKPNKCDLVVRCMKCQPRGNITFSKSKYIRKAKEIVLKNALNYIESVLSKQSTVVVGKF